MMDKMKENPLLWGAGALGLGYLGWMWFKKEEKTGHVASKVWKVNC